MEGLTEHMVPPEPCDAEAPSGAPALPRTMVESADTALQSDFIRKHVPDRILQAYAHPDRALFYEG